VKAIGDMKQHPHKIRTKLNSMLAVLVASLFVLLLEVQRTGVNLF
jgi:hypothetical protein